MTTPVPAKRDLRAVVLAARRAQTSAALDEADTALAARLPELVAPGAALTVCAYVPMAGEPGGPGLPDRLAATPGVARVLLPVLRPDRDLDWAAYAGPGSLAPAAFGLREPAGPRLGVTGITTADLVLVPAVAVDRRGTRLGRGGGSYDRALARVSGGTPVIALLYDGELLDEIPAEAHDQRVNGMLTPSGLRRIPG
ncbi:5-formyltetrahydrofolate cyclo-ligase [Catellatospora coxensis]|uniref:5-formyltetrahydrofolate cyclo-ligase n=1 Tax=Catellatospora coxensis TaxID=310354 RepID=A0A8J3PB97_9ACTN|nr:5-formyltetrahydrofolate cyclo-ligase [Catellatospora coxensis]GIG10667.1 5-formyltetrahydrofolate cyclo-ligase [Catellatospora coxensis]